MYGQISTLAFVGIEARARRGAGAHHARAARRSSSSGCPTRPSPKARERVRNALHAVGLGLPYKHVTVNLAPADLPKEGSQFDLPIVLAMMVAMEAIAPDAVARLRGDRRAGARRLDPRRARRAARRHRRQRHGQGPHLPAACGPEAAWAGEDVDILAAPHLLSLVNHFKGLQTLARPKPNLERAASVAARPARRARARRAPSARSRSRPPAATTC